MVLLFVSSLVQNPRKIQYDERTMSIHRTSPVFSAAVAVFTLAGASGPANIPKPAFAQTIPNLPRKSRAAVEVL
ncbi:hypothetical protein [Bordetella sp. H567]|uniref:hypothetical protein n=1 Tax=Bordetella sp. H567 TaxID=1697043 RepID=UPI0011AB646E|nr:hypothetical protein [Bordetella sp. H567]